MLLVAGSQTGRLIGKQGATVKSIQDDAHCTIQIIGEENLPVFALPDDSVVEIQRKLGGVQKAVELITTHLWKFLVDRSIIGFFETLIQSPNVRANQMTPHSQSWGPSPPAFAMNHVGHGYGPNHASMVPLMRANLITAILRPFLPWTSCFEGFLVMAGASHQDLTQIVCSRNKQ